MPDMISLRSFVLPSLLGHRIVFESNKPTNVPDDVVPEAMAAGCVPADESQRPFIDEVSRAKVDFSGALRNSLLTLAIDELVKQNNSKTFDGAGLPKIDALKNILGFEVFKDERTAIFRAYMSARQKGETPTLHPDAREVLKIIQLESKSELLELAGPDDVVATGLTTKELRKHLLMKYSGIAPS